jgi:hypothetical protein
MKAIMRNLTGAMFIAAAAIRTGFPQGAAQELRLSDLRAQQPQEAIFASVPCQRAKESPRHHIVERGQIDPRTLVPDLGALMETSDEVVLAGFLDDKSLLSPSGESTATYYEVRIIRTWKGPHRSGDVLTFGRPGGLVWCESPGPDRSTFTAQPAGNDWGVPANGPLVYVLFLRHPTDDESKSVQGLRLAAGEGLQGMFLIQVPIGSEAEESCARVPTGSVQHCDSYLATSKSPVIDPYVRDPLAKRYVGMPAADFLREVQSVAAGQGVAKKSSPK